MPKRQTIVAIVEDDPNMLRATTDLLDAHGFATVAFTSAEDFLTRGSPSGSIVFSWILTSEACLALTCGVDSGPPDPRFRSFL